MKWLLFAFGCLLSVQTMATHLIGGYIQAQSVPGKALQYTCTVTLFMNELNSDATAAESSLTLCFGDGTTAEIVRVARNYSTDKTYSANLYTGTHTYAVPGTYSLTVAVQNRTPTSNLANNIGDQPLTLMTQLVTSADLTNSTVGLALPSSGFRLLLNRPATITLPASDADGDSLAYILTRPLVSTSCDQFPAVAAGYQFPNDMARQGTFKLNANTGILVWDAPTQTGRYSVALRVQEWRRGLLIAQTQCEFSLTTFDEMGNSPADLPPYEPASEGLLVLGIEDREATVQLVLYPVPAQEQVKVHFYSRQAEPTTVYLLDLNGGIVKTMLLNSIRGGQGQSLDISSLPAGLYLVQATVEGRTYTRKLVKR